MKISKENLHSKLRTTQWAIITAEKTGNTIEQNASQNGKLVRKLKDMGFNPIPVEGKYSGNIEHSFYVSGLTDWQAHKIGNEFSQESVLTPKGLIYQDQSIAPADLNKIDMSGNRSDYYSMIGNIKFSIPIDFKNRTKLKA